MKIGHEPKNVFVLYLPPLNAFDGPPTESLGNLKERFAQNGEFAGQLIVESYRDLVLPWLKEDVLPSIRRGMKALSNSLWCYVDLLEGLYGERKGKRDVRDRQRLTLANATSVSDAKGLWNKSTEVLSAIDQIQCADTCTAMSEEDANRLSSLQSAIWQVRSVLREENPLLDPPEPEL